MSPRPDVSEERKKQILDAAMIIFARNGFDKTRMDDIAEEAGLSKGSLYWYFKNKEDLFVALVTDVLNNFVAGYELLVDELATLPPPERLKAMISSSGQVFDEVPHVIGLYTDFFIQAWQYERVQKAMADVYSKFIDLTATVIQEGIDGGFFRDVNAHDMAATIGAAVDGAIFQQVLGDSWSFEASMDLLAEVLVLGLMNDGASDA